MSHVWDKKKKREKSRGNRVLAASQNCGAEGVWGKKKLVKKRCRLKNSSQHYMIFLSFFFRGQIPFSPLSIWLGATPWKRCRRSAGVAVAQCLLLLNYLSVITCSALSGAAPHLPSTNPAASGRGGEGKKKKWTKIKFQFLFIWSPLKSGSRSFIFYIANESQYEKQAQAAEKSNKKKQKNNNFIIIFRCNNTDCCSFSARRAQTAFAHRSHPASSLSTQSEVGMDLYVSDVRHKKKKKN